MIAGLQGDGYRRDGLLIRNADGNVVDVAAGAYDTCQILGMDITYAETPDDELPEAVFDFYEAAGEHVLELAMRGWQRGREVALRDFWPPVKKGDRGNRGPRQRRTIHVTTEGWNGEKVVAPQPDVVTPTSRDTRRGTNARPDTSTRRDTNAGAGTKGKGGPGAITGENTTPPPPPGHLVQTDFTKLVMNTKLMAKLSKETKAELRELLTPRQYKDRLVSQVFTALRMQSRGLTSAETILADRLRYELRWSAPDTRLTSLI